MSPSYVPDWQDWWVEKHGIPVKLVPCDALLPYKFKLHVEIECAERRDAEQVFYVGNSWVRKHSRNYLNNQGDPIDLTKLLYK